MTDGRERELRKMNMREGKKEEGREMEEVGEGCECKSTREEKR